MKKHNSITANAQGIVIIDKNGNAVLQRYDHFQDNKQHRSANIAQTADDLDKIHLNLIQRQMFRRLMYGLKEYTPEQIAIFSPTTISRIVEDYKKAKRALHVLKAKKFYEAETKLINAMFPHMTIGENDFDWFIDVPKDVTLRNLSITTKQVIEEFIRKRLLPKNFFSLTFDNLSL